MFGDFTGFWGVNIDAPAGKGNEIEIVFSEEFAERLRASEFFNTIGTYLDAAKSERGDIVNRLAIVAAPGDGRISEMNFARARRNRRVEVRQIDRRIQAFTRAQHFYGNTG